MQAGILLTVCSLVGWTAAFSSLNILKRPSERLSPIHPCDGLCYDSGQVCELSLRGKPMCLQLEHSLSKCSKRKCRPVRVCQVSGGDDDSDDGSSAVATNGDVQCTCRNDCDQRPNTESVCGSDGKTYLSHCHLHRQSCLSKIRISIRERGPCSKVEIKLVPVPPLPIVEGSTFLLRCEVLDGDFQRIDWFKNGAPLIPSARVIIQGRGDRLIIPNALVSDSGFYTCRAQGAGHDLIVINVTPRPCPLPQIVFPPKDVAYKIDSAAIIVNLKPKLQKILDLKHINQLVKWHATRLSSPSSVAVINAVNVLDVVGIVNVTAELTAKTLIAYDNAIKRINSWFDGAVATRPKTVELFGLYDVRSLALPSSDAVRISAAIDAVTIIKHLTKNRFVIGDISSIEQKAFGGQMIYLYCLSSSSENSVSWSQDGVSIDTTTNSRRARLMPGGGLWIPGFRPFDAGVYTCVAANSCGVTAKSGTISFVETGTFANSHFESLAFVDATLRDVTFANATIERLELRDVVASNLVFRNVTVVNLIAHDFVANGFIVENVTVCDGEYVRMTASNVTMKNASHSLTMFADVVIRNMTSVDSKYADVTFLNYTTIDATLIGMTWRNVTAVNVTHVNQTRINSIFVHQSAVNYTEIHVTVINSTENDCQVKNYTATNVTTLHYAMHNVTIVDATTVNCNVTNGFYLGVRFVNVTSTGDAETDVRRHDTTTAAGRFVDFKATRVVSEHSVYSDVTYETSTLVDVSYNRVLFCHVTFNRAHIDGLNVVQSELGFVQFRESSAFLIKSLRSIRYYELVLPGPSTVTTNPNLLYDPTLNECRERLDFGAKSLPEHDCREVTVCEHSIARLACPSGEAMNIEKADYGRQDRETCSFQLARKRLLRNTHCERDVTSTLKRLCNGKSRCFVPVSNAMLGNPCVNTYKYLTVTYSCGQFSRGCIYSKTAALSKSELSFGLPKFVQK